MKHRTILAAACVCAAVFSFPLSGNSALQKEPAPRPAAAAPSALGSDSAAGLTETPRGGEHYLASIRGGGLPCLRNVNFGGDLEEIKYRNAKYIDPQAHLPETLTVEGDPEFNAKVKISSESGAELREYEMHQNWIEKMTYTLTLDGGMLPGVDEAYARHFKRLCQEVKNGGYGQPYLDQTPYRCEWKSKAGAQVVLRYYTPKRDPECKYPCLVLTMETP